MFINESKVLNPHASHMYNDTNCCASIFTHHKGDVLELCWLTGLGKLLVPLI